MNFVKFAFPRWEESEVLSYQSSISIWPPLNQRSHYRNTLRKCRGQVLLESFHKKIALQYSVGIHLYENNGSAKGKFPTWIVRRQSLPCIAKLKSVPSMHVCGKRTYSGELRERCTEIKRHTTMEIEGAGE